MIWLVMVMLAIVNGFFRDAVLAVNIGEALVLPISGISLCILIFGTVFLTFPLVGKNRNSVYFAVGLQWVLMTLLFEVIFGHYVQGKSWLEVSQVFNLLEGNLFVVVLFVTLISPYLVAKIKNI